MASYEKGAFEALQWAWSMLSRKTEDSSSIEEAKTEIQSRLADLSKGQKINFREIKYS